MNKRYWIVDASLCTGCYSCQIACKDEHVDNDWRPYAAPQPNIGQFWMKLTEHVRGTLPKVKLHYLPVFCAHCETAPCMEACPENALYRRDGGLVLLGSGTCRGCGQCAEACPLGAVYKNDELGIYQKCTGCAHLLDDGNQIPRCVAACHSGALRLAEQEEIHNNADELQGICPAEYGPHVLYKNIPGYFVAGAIYAGEPLDVVAGARCLLSNEYYKAECISDGFGDFWFHEVPAGIYTLEIIAENKKYFFESAVQVKTSVNLNRMLLQTENGKSRISIMQDETQY